MKNQKLIDFLQEETVQEDLENKNLLHEFPEFGNEVRKAINSGNLTGYTKELSDMLEDMDLYKASLLSNFIGFACEKEGDTSAGRGIIKLFCSSCTYVYEMFKSMESDDGYQIPDDMKDVYGKNKDWARAYYGFETLCISAMTFLARDAALRNFLPESGVPDLIIYLSEAVPYSPFLKSIHYVKDILSTCSDLKLLVLYPEQEKGFFASANDINNCFHLLFLLEEQIYQRFSKKYGMSTFDAAEPLASLAHGNYPEDCWDKSYSTFFMECNYRAAFHPQFKKGDGIPLIWGEMPPEAIPEIDGYGVIVLLERGISRSFSSQFLAVPHTALTPYVEIERELETTEYHTWMNKIRNHR